MAEKETKNERRLREEEEAQTRGPFNITKRPVGPLGQLANLITGEVDERGYGTSRHPGAVYAGDQVSRKIHNTEGKTALESLTDPRVRQARREAAAEQRREDKEPRKYAKGGKVKSASARADGCAQRGKTRGRMV